MDKSVPLTGIEVFMKDKEITLVHLSSETGSKSFGIRKSRSGLAFSSAKERFVITSALGIKESPAALRSIAVSELSDSYFLTYLKKTGDAFRLYGAVSENGLRWKKVGPVSDIKSFGMVVPEYSFENHFVLYHGNRSIRLSVSPDLKRFDDFPKAVLEPRKTGFDRSGMRVARLFLTDEGIALFYLAKNAKKMLCLGAALFDKDSPGKLLWRSKEPLWEQPEHWSANKTRLVGIIAFKERFLAYFQQDGGKIYAQALHHRTKNTPRFIKKKPAKKKTAKRSATPKLTRHPKNPILEPLPENSWEAFATFNPAALCLDGTVHLLYRAQGHDGLSVLGYASSKDGFTVRERQSDPAYIPSQTFECATAEGKTYRSPYMSGGGWGGCEDPRLSHIGKRIYMTYVAFNGIHPPGVALTSIREADFREKRWRWAPPKLISREGQIQKNWVLFPEKIRGRYAILHSISPNILVDYFESLDQPELVIDSYHNGHSRDADRWDNYVRGVGAPPLRTAAGWLVFYHAMDRRDPNKYKLGAMLLDIEDPRKVLHRSAKPILEPEEHYENGGYKHGVVYVCGAVVKDGTLLVYYGGSDRCVAVASAPVGEFLHQLTEGEDISLHSVKLS